MSESFYQPKTEVKWNSPEAFTQFQRWKREVNRILNGPLKSKEEDEKVNHVFIWAGAEAEDLVDSKTKEDPSLKLDTPKEVLDCLESCITHSTYFREARELFYGVKQQAGETSQTFYSRILQLHQQSKFPQNSDFLIVDKLIHGCYNRDCKRKLLDKDNTAKAADCLKLMRLYESNDSTMKALEGSSTATLNATPAKSRSFNKKFQKQTPDRAATGGCTRCGNPKHTFRDLDFCSVPCQPDGSRS